jgi:hypothetical protein
LPKGCGTGKGDCVCPLTDRAAMQNMIGVSILFMC